MEIGIIGSGKMGMNMAMRLKNRCNIACCDVDETILEKATERSIMASFNIEGIINRLHTKNYLDYNSTGKNKR